MNVESLLIVFLLFWTWSQQSDVEVVSWLWELEVWPRTHLFWDEWGTLVRGVLWTKSEGLKLAMLSQSCFSSQAKIWKVGHMDYKMFKLTLLILCTRYSSYSLKGFDVLNGKAIIHESPVTENTWFHSSFLVAYFCPRNLSSYNVSIFYDVLLYTNLADLSWAV